jgi:hypothetical protein
MITFLRDIWSGAWIKRQAEPNPPPPPETPWFGVLIQLRRSTPGPIPHAMLRDALHQHLHNREVETVIANIVNTVITEVRIAKPELIADTDMFQITYTTMAGDQPPATHVVGLAVSRKEQA